MKKTYLIVLVALGMLGTIVGCSEDSTNGDDGNNGNNGTKSNAELLIGAWTVSEAKIDPPFIIFGDTIDDFTDMQEPCDADDVQIFKENGIYTFDEGATKCDPNDPQSEDGTYELSADGKALTIYDQEDTINMTILEINESMMKGETKMEDEDFPDESFTITFTFNKQ